MLAEEETKRCGGNTIINNINNVTTVVNTAPCVRQKLTAYDQLKRIHEHVLTSMQRQLVASKDRPVFLIPEPNDLFKLSYNISNIYISSLSTQKGQASELNLGAFKMVADFLVGAQLINEDAFITSQYAHELLPKVLEVIEKYEVKDEKAVELLRECKTFINGLKKEVSLLDF
jgi:hypothetical protein